MRAKLVTVHSKWHLLRKISYQKRNFPFFTSNSKISSSFADIFRDEKDTETYFEPNNKSPRGFNQIHINAL